MKTIKLQFLHFWEGFDHNQHFAFLRKHYRFELSDDPDFVIFSVFVNGRNVRRTPRVKSKAVRVFFTPENVVPNMRRCDFAFGFCLEEKIKSDRYFRAPNYPFRLWASGFGGEDLIKHDVDLSKLLDEKTRFCNFVYSNPRATFRNRFFEKLSKYKRVDSAGDALNNTGAPLPKVPGRYDGVRHKLDFMRYYKFTIAFENESAPGYTTEKIVEPMLVSSLPIYWGNPDVHRDFNARSFVNYFGSCRNLDDLVDLVVAIDRNNDLYERYAVEPYLVGNRLSPYLDEDCVVEKFRRIFG